MVTAGYIGGRVARSHAIPMMAYRRQQLWAQTRPRLLILALALALYSIAGSPWDHPRAQPFDASWREGAAAASSRWTVPLTDTQAAGPILTAAVPKPAPPAAVGYASLDGLHGATVANIDIALSFLDGAVIEPGDQLSFDDTARTWDYEEDARYFMGTATSARGLVYMRGGGVCWVSTALWRAALEAGLRTDFRENHYGLVDLLGPGLDATNTLVIRNDADLPITVRAWRDEDEVYVALFSDGPLDRSGTLRGPERLGRGLYAVYQDVAWDDGRTTSSEFVSRYYW
jgi:hypothetical protein